MSLRPRGNDRMGIATLDEYDYPRLGSFHFLDPSHKEEYEKELARVPRRKLPSKRLYQTDSGWEFNAEWTGISTKDGEFSCYSLLLPKFAIPSFVRFLDPRSGGVYAKKILRDDERRRFVLYLKCQSRSGSFDFKLDVRFQVCKQSFAGAKYFDKHTVGRAVDSNK